LNKSKVMEISLSDSESQKLIDTVKEQLSNHLVGLVNMKRANDGEDVPLICGSGTLVTIDDIHGILTADHVLGCLSSAMDITLLIMHGRKHKGLRIPKQLVRMIKLARGPVGSEGPDLGFIVLPRENIGDLKARKSFFNLSNKRERMLNKPPDRILGMWCLLGGVPDENAYLDSLRIKKMNAFCFQSFIEKEYSKNGFDYFEFPVDYSASKIIPKDFGGFSGGGLWQVPLGKKEDDSVLVPLEPILSGVAFYQYIDEDEKEGFIKCHGRRSIYDYLINKVLNECP